MGIYGINPKINFLTKILKKKNGKIQTELKILGSIIKVSFRRESSFTFIYLFQLSRSYISSIFSIPSMVR